MKRFLNILREPILLFFILGFLLFILYERASGYVDRYNKRVYVSQSQVALLEETYTNTWNRQPEGVPTAVDARREEGDQARNSSLVRLTFPCRIRDPAYPTGRIR